MDFLQSRSSRTSAATFCRIASTSAREIGFAVAAAAGVAEGVAVFVGEGEGEGAVAVVPVEEGAAEADVEAGVTPAACFEPKIADTILPKTLILCSCRCLLLAPTARTGGRRGFRSAKTVNESRLVLTEESVRVTRCAEHPEQAERPEHRRTARWP